MAGMPWEDYQPNTLPTISAGGDQAAATAPWEDYAPVKEEGTLTKLARMPKEAIAEYGSVGKAASYLVPDTPGQWGALAALTGAQFIPGLGQAAAAVKIAPWVFRAGASALGAIGGSAAGGERDPVELAKEGAGAAAGQVIGEGAGNLIGKAAGYIGRQAKGGVQKLLDEYGGKLAEIIPGLSGQKFTPTRFADVVLGGKGDKALSDAFDAGVNDITQKVGPNAFLQSPTITKIINKYLPKSEYTSDLSILGRAGATAPAHLVLGGETTGNAISVDKAIKAAQELGARARIAAKAPEGGILGRDLSQANRELRQAIADELDNTSAGAGDIYRQINDAFHKGSTVLEVLKANKEDIFGQGATKAKIDAGALARAHNMAAAELEKAGAADLGAASRRGADIGAGDVQTPVPFTSLFFGGGGPLHGRISPRGLTVPTYAGQPSAGSPASPYVSGPIGQITLNRLIEELKRLQQNQGQ